MGIFNSKLDNSGRIWLHRSKGRTTDSYHESLYIMIETWSCGPSIGIAEFFLYTASAFELGKSRFCYIFCRNRSFTAPGGLKAGDSITTRKGVRVSALTIAHQNKPTS
jgi:hypothetical protein